jgi:hypothetical protein
LLFGLIAGFILLEQSCKKHPKNTQTDYNKELITVKESMFPQQFANQFMLSFFKSIHDTALINSGFSKIDSASVKMTNQNDTLCIRFEYWTNPHNHTNIWHHHDSYNHYRAGTYSFIADSLFLTSHTGNVEILVEKEFYYDSLPVDIRKIHISKTGLNQNGNQTFKVIFDDLTMNGNYAHKASCSFKAEFNYELYSNNRVYSGNNDFYLFSGNISGNTSVGINYEIEIDPDTRYKIDYHCFYTIEGKSTVNYYGDENIQPKAFLDFISEDGCSNQYTITIPEIFSTMSSIEPF